MIENNFNYGLIMAFLKNDTHVLDDTFEVYIPSLYSAQPETIGQESIQEAITVKPLNTNNKDVEEILETTGVITALNCTSLRTEHKGDILENEKTQYQTENNQCSKGAPHNHQLIKTIKIIALTMSSLNEIVMPAQSPVLGMFLHGTAEMEETFCVLYIPGSIPRGSNKPPYIK